VALKAVQQPPQPKELFGPDRVGQPAQDLGGELLDHRG
jgi:hypothetical protein